MPPQPLHDCPGRCGRKVIYARLSCPECWVRLPAPLKAELGAAYRERARNPLAHVRAVGKALRWYREQDRA